MFGSEILEVGTGLAFIFLVASLLATALRESLEAVLKTRAVQLERGLRQMLDDPDGTRITKALFDHSLVFGLFEGQYAPQRDLRPYRLPWLRTALSLDGPAGRVARQRTRLNSSLPAYIPSRNFALALLDLVGGDAGRGVLSLDAVKANAMALPEGRVRQAVLLALSEAGNDFDRARTSLEAWYDGTMDRVSGWYKRETQWILLLIGFGIAAVFNINSIAILGDLSSNNALRQAVIARVDSSYASLKTDQTTSPELKAQLTKLSSELTSGLSDVIGWERHSKRFDAEISRAKADGGNEDWAKARFWASAFLGWLLTAFAVSLGAPFWFDLLNKFMVIRSTVKSYEKSTAEGSEDRAGGRPAADRLSPAPGGGAAGAAAAAPPQGPQRLAPVLESPAVTLRIAVNRVDLDDGTLRFTRTGSLVPVPDDGFLELPLVVGETHALAATAERRGAQVTWSMTRTATLDDEGEPVAAVLA